MQVFKEIPYQNYIELKFSSKNLNDLSQQEALLKYKRNAQLLTEIFTFNPKEHEQTAFKEKITQEEVEAMALTMKQEQELDAKKVEEIKETARKYELLFNKIANVKSKQEMMEMVTELKKEQMYDYYHPFFVQDSPFYLQSTNHQYLEAPKAVNLDEEGLSFLQIN